MDDIIFEQDYRRTPEDTAENARALEIFDRAFNGSFIKDYTAAMDAIPKVIVPEDKKNYVVGRDLPGRYVSGIYPDPGGDG